MINLSYINEVYFFAILSAAFSLLYNYIIAEGEILEFLGKAIDKLPKWIGKPLGGCIFCQNFWTTLIGALAVVYLLNDLIFIAAIPVSFALLLLLNALIYGRNE